MTSCTSNGASADTAATAISVAEAKAHHGRAGVEFVDPRPAEAIAATTGKIPGARLVTFEQVEAGDLPGAFADRTIRVVASCQAGPMAARAATAFAAQGFANVHWVEGGTQAWADAGHPVVR